MYGYKKLVKLYKITFNSYVNTRNDTVTNDDGEHITIPKVGLIIREDEIEQYKSYGDGIKELSIVGEMIIDTRVK